MATKCRSCPPSRVAEPPAITHHRTGERITFLESDPLVMEDELPAGGGRPREHIHPAQAEEFEVLRGSYTLVVDGGERRLGAGDSAQVPPGTAHCGWSDDGAVLRITFTPALRWEQFVRRLFAGEPAARLLHHFRDEIRLP
jgi:mannose-6-phosphate isomerase-like protein (cupin superfamily)